MLRRATQDVEDGFAALGHPRIAHPNGLEVSPLVELDELREQTVRVPRLPHDLGKGLRRQRSDVKANRARAPAAAIGSAGGTERYDEERAAAPCAPIHDGTPTAAARLKQSAGRSTCAPMLALSG